jgi:hypothetical protein
MANLGRWIGGVIGSTQPSTSWAAPANLFPTQQRNDGSIYSFASATSTLTLPSGPDGYLLRANFRFEDSSNGRLNPVGRIVLAGGTGNMLSTQVAGYNRDNSEDTSYVQTVAVIDAPSAGATVQFQWMRGTDAPGTSDGTTQSAFEVIPLYYSNILMASGSTGQPTGSNPTKVSILDNEIVASDSAAISLASNTVTLKGDNKRYLVIGGHFADYEVGRTCRLLSIDHDGVPDPSTRSYCFIRQTSNGEQGMMLWDIVETATADIDLTILLTGGGFGSGELGAESLGDQIPGGGAEHDSLVVIELNDSAEVFRSHDSQIAEYTGGQEISPDDNPVPINVMETSDFNDAASFTKASSTAINVTTAMDALVGANIIAGSTATVPSTNRFTGAAHITKNGTPDPETLDGSFQRGDQSSSGTNGWSAQPGGFLALAANDDIGLATTRLLGTEFGTQSELQTMGASLFAINLDSLEDISGAIAGSVSEGSTASDARAATQIAETTVSEGPTASEASTATQVAETTVSEGPTASDSSAAAKVTDAAVSEGSTASEARAATVTQAAIEASVSEGSTADDARAVTRVAETAVSEGLTASDAPVVQAYKTATRTVTLVSQTGTVEGSVSEGSTADDARAVTRVAETAVSEGSTASYASAATQIAEAAVSEGSAASDARAAAKVTDASISEGSTSDDARAATKVAETAVSEGPTASDARAVTQIAETAVSEGPTASDASAATQIAETAVSEGSAASDARAATQIAETAVSEGSTSDDASTAAQVTETAVSEGSTSDDASTAAKVAETAVSEGSTAAEDASSQAYKTATRTITLIVESGTTLASVSEGAQVTAVATTTATIEAVVASQVEASVSESTSVIAEAIVAAAVSAGDAATVSGVIADAVSESVSVGATAVATAIRLAAAAAGVVLADSATETAEIVGSVTSGAIAGETVETDGSALASVTESALADTVASASAVILASVPVESALAGSTQSGSVGTRTVEASVTSGVSAGSGQTASATASASTTEAAQAVAELGVNTIYNAWLVSSVSADYHTSYGDSVVTVAVSETVRAAVTSLVIASYTVGYDAAATAADDYGSAANYPEEVVEAAYLSTEQLAGRVIGTLVAEGVTVDVATAARMLLAAEVSEAVSLSVIETVTARLNAAVGFRVEVAEERLQQAFFTASVIDGVVVSSDQSNAAFDLTLETPGGRRFVVEVDIREYEACDNREFVVQVDLREFEADDDRQFVVEADPRKYTAN